MVLPRPLDGAKEATNQSSKFRLLVLLLLVAALVASVVGSPLFEPSEESDLRATFKNTRSSSGVADVTNRTTVDKKANDNALYATLLANADRKIAERRAWLGNSHSEAEQFGSLRKESLWYMFPPVLPCFWTFEKEPSSAVLHDGGKWLCGMQELHEQRAGDQPADSFGVGKHYGEPCIVYSMGSNNEFSFEARVRKLAPGCEIHTFDPTVNETGKGKPYYDAYHGDYGFGAIDSKSGPFQVKSLKTILMSLKHTHVDYLKADVEGYEWEIFDKVDWKSAKIGQILIELHPGGRFKRQPTAKEMDGIFTKMEDAGFRLISLEPVTYTNFGQVELVFIHKDWRPGGKW